jgi:hypothetical protein
MVGSRGRSRRAFGVVSVVGIVLVGCGSDSGGSGADAPSSPLAELFGWNDFNSVEARQQQLEIEEAVVSCMREEGFEYVAQDYGALSEADTADADAGLFDDPEAYGKKYGYGVVRNYELYELPYINEDGSGAGGPVYDDPNQEYLDSLSETETNDYYAALYGQQTTDVADTVPVGTEPEVYVSPPLEEQGCQGRARLDVVGEDPSQDPEVQQALTDYYESQRDDPQLEQAFQKWAECMTDPLAGIEVPDGMTVTSPDSMYMVIDAQKAGASGQELVPLDPETGEPVGDIDPSTVYSSSQNEDGTGFAQIGEPSAIGADELERLRKLELELWADDWSCQQDAKIQDIRTQLEQNAVDDLVQQFPELASSEGG